MPLNYSKWDNLELSDDSDIEEHPNVDKKSMIRWKQRDIHEKREQRKLQIAKLNSEIALNAVLRPRIQTVLDGMRSKGLDHFRAVQRRIKESPSDEKPNTGAPNQPTYDMMLAQLLGDVFKEGAYIVDGASVTGWEVKVDGRKVDDKTPLPGWAEGVVPDSKTQALQQALEGRLEWHLSELDRRDGEVKKEIEEEEAEQKRKITSDDIKEGWSASSVVKPKPSPLDDVPKSKPKAKQTQKTETIEVLNPSAASSSSKPASAPEDEEDEDEEAFGPLTPSARQFANIALGDFRRSYEFIQRDSSVLTNATHDSLLAEAFDAERRGDKGLAKRCVHQSLLVNYCRQLGKDGVGLFFQKMIAQNPKSLAMFNQDLDQTYGRIETRTKELILEESQQEREQIQLVAQDPNMTIAFNLPDGPPPEDLRVEGEGSEELDMDQVRAFLQRKWEIFEGFRADFKAALKTENLDKVNEVLGKMKVAEAEEVVELMQEGGMLSFSERGVRDMTKPDQ